MRPSLQEATLHTNVLIADYVAVRVHSLSCCLSLLFCNNLLIMHAVISDCHVLLVVSKKTVYDLTLSL